MKSPRQNGNNTPGLGYVIMHVAWGHMSGIEVAYEHLMTVIYFYHASK